MRLALVILFSLSVSRATLADQEPTRVPIASLSAVADPETGYMLSGNAPLCRAALRAASTNRETEGAQCRWIAWGLKRTVQLGRTPLLYEEAIIGVWFKDGTVGLFSFRTERPSNEGADRWKLDGHFADGNTYLPATPLYLPAAEVERNRARVGEFIRMTTFGYYGILAQEGVLYLAADRGWLGEAIAGEMARGLGEQERTRRYHVALKALGTEGDPILPWEENDTAGPGASSRPAGK